TTDQHGLDPQCVEATAFAWLAHCRLEGRPANLPSVTGSRPLYDTRPDRVRDEPRFESDEEKCGGSHQRYTSPAAKALVSKELCTIR
ncbi:MAG: anhydro-N-acetylmuramic acid kinase, partial [bacterium]